MDPVEKDTGEIVKDKSERTKRFVQYPTISISISPSRRGDCFVGKPEVVILGTLPPDLQW